METLCEELILAGRVFPKGGKEWYVQGDGWRGHLQHRQRRSPLGTRHGWQLVAVKAHDGEELPPRQPSRAKPCPARQTRPSRREGAFP